MTDQSREGFIEYHRKKLGFAPTYYTGRHGEEVCDSGQKQREDFFKAGAEWQAALSTRPAAVDVGLASTLKQYDEQEGGVHWANIALRYLIAQLRQALATSPCGSISPSAQTQQGDGVPDGWKLVPIEPTMEMIRASSQHIYASETSIERAKLVYKDAIAAAPQPAKGCA